MTITRDQKSKIMMKPKSPQKRKYKPGQKLQIGRTAGEDDILAELIKYGELYNYTEKYFYLEKKYGLKIYCQIN